MSGNIFPFTNLYSSKTNTLVYSWVDILIHPDDQRIILLVAFFTNTNSSKRCSYEMHNEELIATLQLFEEWLRAIEMGL